MPNKGAHPSKKRLATVFTTNWPDLNFVLRSNFQAIVKAELKYFNQLRWLVSQPDHRARLILGAITRT